jgi:cardiolipin synthase
MLKRWLAFFIFFLSSQNIAQADQLIVEPDMGRSPILFLIKQAKNSIQLVMYGFTDPTLLRALENAKQNGKEVNVLLEPHPYKSEDENKEVIQKLQTANVTLLTPNPDVKLTHQKTLLTDQNRALIMTFNFTRSTFSNERNFALLIDNPEEIQEISQVFTADTQHKNFAVQQPNLIWSPNNSREKILEMIQNAHSEIKMYAQDISDYQTIGALAKAARAGKTVEILLSKPKNDTPNKKITYLRKSGVNIRFSDHYFIHAKVIIVDHQRAELGSINFTRPSMNDNRELSVITQDPKVISQLISTFDQDWNNIITPFAKGGRRAFFARLGNFAMQQISPPRKKHASTLFFKEGKNSHFQTEG